MKKITVLVSAVLLSLVLAACGKEANIEFPFEVSDVKNVEIFHYFNPAEAEKKILTAAEDIAGTYRRFESISIKDKASEPSVGGSVISFRFNLSDGSAYEIIYGETAVKAGRIITTDLEHDFFTSANIEAFWERYDNEAVAASEDELPILPEKRNSDGDSDALQWDRIPMVMVNGELYYDTGKESSRDGRCGVMDGKITSTIDGTQIPEKDNQSNFGTGFEFQYVDDNTIEIFMNEKWIIFERRDDSGNYIRFNDHMVDSDKISKETLEWLEWYNNLTEEEQNKVSSIPPELVDKFSIAETEDAQKMNAK